MNCLVGGEKDSVFCEADGGREVPPMAEAELDAAEIRQLSRPLPPLPPEPDPNALMPPFLGVHLLFLKLPPNTPPELLGVKLVALKP